MTGESTGSAMLERLDRANLFLVPLDDQRRWYRYHHLFGDLLRSRLLDEHADVAELHRRASTWHDESRRSGGCGPARAGRRRRRTGQPTWWSWRFPSCAGTGRRQRCGSGSTSCPTAVVERRPVLAMGFVGALMASNEFDDIERRLGDIEQTLNAPEPGAPELVVRRRDRTVAGCRAASSCTGPRWRSSAATLPAPWITPGWQSTWRPSTTT